MKNKLIEYLKQEWKYNNHKKYQKYFDEWFENLTDVQILYFESFSNGKKSPFVL